MSDVFNMSVTDLTDLIDERIAVALPGHVATAVAAAVTDAPAAAPLSDLPPPPAGSYAAYLAAVEKANAANPAEGTNPLTEPEWLAAGSPASPADVPAPEVAPEVAP